MLLCPLEKAVLWYDTVKDGWSRYRWNWRTTCINFFKCQMKSWLSQVKYLWYSRSLEEAPIKRGQSTCKYFPIIRMLWLVLYLTVIFLILHYNIFIVNSVTVTPVFYIPSASMFFRFFLILIAFRYSDHSRYGIADGFINPNKVTKVLLKWLQMWLQNHVTIDIFL
jgi:hypothetical protein